MAVAIAAVTVIGFTAVTPAKADDDDWRYRREERREDHPRSGIYFYFGAPAPYGYYTPQPYGYYEYHDHDSR